MTVKVIFIFALCRTSACQALVKEFGATDIVEGVALVQERGGSVHTLRANEAIYTAPAVEHWHRPTADSFMAHLVIWEAPAPNSNQPETFGVSS